MKMHIKLMLLMLVLMYSTAFAGCPQFYPNGKVIEVPNSVELCNSFYVVDFDTRLHAPVISAEKFRVGNHPDRSNDFHPDDRLSGDDKASHGDYAKSGFDQGHLTPAADATTDSEMHDTFLLSNMTPQEPTLNRESWRMIEIHVRQLAPDYVVTGAIYPSKLRFIGVHRIPVPSGYYKIVWKDGIITAWYAPNEPGAQVIGSSIESIEVMTGLNFPRD